MSDRLISTDYDPHQGNPCDDTRRFTCRVCRRSVCWCVGGDSDERFVGAEHWCSDCWYTADRQLAVEAFESGTSAEDPYVDLGPPEERSK